ncbi:MAG: winged helix-turn-helix domain-containing protein [Acidobacteriota bacterium]
MESLSTAEARALALAAQGLAGPRPATVDRRALRALAEQLGVVQIDSVNVLVRSHYLPAFSRLGTYDRAALDALSHAAPRALFEYWGHEASLLPVALHPLLRWRMARAHETAWGHVRRMGKRTSFVSDVLAIVRERGPIAASAIELGAKKSRGKWWEWSEAKRAIEWLFWSGQVTSARRKGFERLYDLPERVLPARVIAAATPAEADAQRALIERSARALGVATEADLRDYYRLKPRQARPAIAALVEAGVLVPVRVEGWAQPAYRHRATPAPPAIERDRAALLSPFDSLIWARERTERMFGMTFRLEIYVPQPKRVHGYYVLPLLLGDRLVARVDLKADRAAGALRVQAAHAEPGVPRRRVTRALAGELARMAAWLELARVELVPRGDLAHMLSRSLP